MTRSVSLDAKQIETKLRDLSREPFQDVLALLLRCKPDKKSLQEFAKSHPDRWAQAIAIFSRGAGYSDKTVVEHNFYHWIHNLSDAELQSIHQEYKHVIDADYVEVQALPEPGNHQASPDEEERHVESLDDMSGMSG